MITNQCIQYLSINYPLCQDVTRYLFNAVIANNSHWLVTIIAEFQTLVSKDSVVPGAAIDCVQTINRYYLYDELEIMPIGQ